jgi:hypothetical protein
MKEVNVRVYEDHFIVTNESGGRDVADSVEQLATLLRLPGEPLKPKRTYPKGTRKRRTKAEIDAAKPKAEAVA